MGEVLTNEMLPHVVWGRTSMQPPLDLRHVDDFHILAEPATLPWRAAYPLMKIG